MKPRALFSASPANASVPSSTRPTLSHVQSEFTSQNTAHNADNSTGENGVRPASGASGILMDALRGAARQIEDSYEAAAALNADAESAAHLQRESAAEIAALKAQLQSEDSAQLIAANEEVALLKSQIASLQADLDEASTFIEEMEDYNAKAEREWLELQLAPAQQTKGENPEAEGDESDDATARFHRDLQEITQHFESQVGELEAHNAQTEKLLEGFGPLCDLRLTDLPSRILEAACATVGAEVALLTDASAMDSVALRAIGELSPRVAYELFEFTQNVRNAKMPVIENQSSKTPAGCGFANLIALPFAPAHESGGVLLLANKRDGEFTENDAHLLGLLEKQIGVALENDRLYLQREELFNNTIAVLADVIEARDPYVRGHCESLMRLAVEVGKRFGLKAEQLDEVRLAALLHDIGKIGVPDSILLKTGTLTDEEQAIVKEHPVVGYDLVFHVPSLQWLANGILHHHENWDGSGYPRGLAGKNIPLAARIVGAVDAFDAMTTPRLYRQAISAQEALDEMKRCAGTQFDPAVVEVLHTLMQEGQKTQEHAAERIEQAATPRPRVRRDALKRSAEQSSVALMNLDDEAGEGE